MKHKIVRLSHIQLVPQIWSKKRLIQKYRDSFRNTSEARMTSRSTPYSKMRNSMSVYTIQMGTRGIRKWWWSSRTIYNLVRQTMGVSM